MSKTPAPTTTPLSREACVQYLQSEGLYTGHSRDTIDQLRELVAKHQGRKDRVTEATKRPSEKAMELADAEQAEGPQPAADPAERLKLAKAEHKVLQAWIKNGEKPPRPATPNLDAVNEDYAARGGKPASTKSRKATTAKVERPAPTAPKGSVVIPLRNENHGTIIADNLGKTKGATIDGAYLVVVVAEAQGVYDTLVGAAPDASQFHARLLNLAALGIRQACPKVTDDRNTLVVRLVNALVASDRNWSVGAAPDATPTFTISGATYTTTKVAAEAVGVPAKAEAAKAA